MINVDTKLTWGIQSSGVSATNPDALMDTLVTLNIPYVPLGLIPFTDKIIGQSDLPKKTIFYGSTKLIKLIHDLNALYGSYNPGVFFDYFKFNVEAWQTHRTDMLNAYTYVKAKSITNDVFVRPIHDLKDFSGGVYESVDAIPFVSVDPEKSVAITTLKNVEREYRVFIVNNKVVTGSQYKVDGRLNISTDFPLEIAQNLVKGWLPNKNVVMDIALYKGEYKIIEFNCLNGSGLYACNPKSIVESINVLYY